MTRYYSLKDVAEHGTTESPWLIINNKVYDVTGLLNEHPGGQSVILRFAGMTQDTKIVARTQTVALAETYLIVLLCCALVACFFGSAQLIIGKDATSAFYGTAKEGPSALYGRNHSDSAKKWLKDFEIGELGDQTKPWWQSPLFIAVGVAAVAAVAAVTFSVVRSRH